jgi:hypothetical protein
MGNMLNYFINGVQNPPAMWIIIHFWWFGILIPCSYYVFLYFFVFMIFVVLWALFGNGFCHLSCVCVNNDNCMYQHNSAFQSIHYWILKNVFHFMCFSTWQIHFYIVNPLINLKYYKGEFVIWCVWCYKFVWTKTFNQILFCHWKCLMLNNISMPFEAPS